jgi:Leucine-rich repeat (LRR) protein
VYAYSLFMGSILTLVGSDELLLGDNHFTGSIPASLEDAVSLEIISLFRNDLEGPLPSLSKLSNLKTLIFNNTLLEGSIPRGWGDLSRLEILDLSEMGKVNTTIPQSFTKLSRLTTLILDGTRIRGTIPESLGDMIALQSFFASQTEISGSIPTSVGLLPNLSKCINTKTEFRYFDDEL